MNTTKAILTVNGLNNKNAEEIKNWLKEIIKNLGKEDYSKVVRFRLMK